MLRLFSALAFAATLALSTAQVLAATPVDLANEINAQIARCWNPPPGATGSVTVRIELSQDGRVIGKPKVTGLASSGVAASAIRAVELCEPYKLPVSMFSIWQHTSIKLSLDK